MKNFKKILPLLSVAAMLSSCAATFELARNPANVLYVSPTGSDATGWYGTSNRPWGHISAAINAAQPGDKIIVYPGTYTGESSCTLPDMVRVIGSGTNNTFTDITSMYFGHSNEVSGISFTNRSGLIGQGMLKSSSASGQLYVHDIVVLAGPECMTVGSIEGEGGGPQGWNVFSNCLFDTKEYGVECFGTNYFYNCRIQKNADQGLSFGAMLLGAVNGQPSWIYWSGGSLTSTTNSNSGLNDSTNNWAVWNGNTQTPSLTYIQNTTISIPTNSGYAIFGIALNTNFTSNVIYNLGANRTNATAVVTSFGGFSNTNSQAWKFQASWQRRINTNAMFLLPAPPTNSP